MEEIISINVFDFSKQYSIHEVYDSSLAVIEINGNDLPNKTITSIPFRCDGFSVFVPIEGEMTVDINYMTYRIERNMPFILADICVIENMLFSSDFKGYNVWLSRESGNGIIRNISGIPAFRNNSLHIIPNSASTQTDIQILVEHVQRIRKSIADKNNPFYKHIIWNELSIFIMQFLYIQSMHIENTIDLKKLGRKEEIAWKFIDLMLGNFKKEHELGFYANKLCITTEYLSKIMKEFSGKTVNRWLSNALMSEAKILLRQPELTIQQVSEELNFSDQSYFGRFFKKHTGKSPLEYKNSLSK